MAVIVQRIIGNRCDNRFYPHFSGVARSHNSYPASPMKSEDGIVAVALGLGQSVVDGSAVLSFCPRYPRQILQLSDPKEFLDSSQRAFYALDLAHSTSGPFPRDPRPGRFDLDLAEQDGVLATVGSTYSYENDALYDGVARPGVRVVSFAPILKHGSFPLAEILQFLMDMGSWGMNSPVEIEFAVNLEPGDGAPRQFGILQIRPLVVNQEIGDLRIGDVRDEDLICRSPKVLGSGRIDHLRDIVFVDVERFDRSKSRDVAAEVA
jgi:hypothetical protein